MNRALVIAALTLALPFAVQAADKTPKPIPLVKVGDYTITNLDFAVYRAQNPIAGNQPKQQIALLNELVNTYMVAHSKEGEAVAKLPAVQAAIQVAKARLVTQALIQERLAHTPVTDQEIQAAYAKEYTQAPHIEIQASHILLRSKKAAEAVIAELNKGAKFATLAKEKSIGPSASNGGSLGWFEPDQMVKPFADALLKLKDGEYTQTPVHTQFGWHVIEREHTRHAPPPTLSKVREQIIRQIRTEKLREFILGLREKTKIEILQKDKKVDK